MATSKLQNYLRTYRKRASLSQDEVAYLLGTRSGTKVSRYENFSRQPTLRTVFAYEAIFGVSARELFRGTFDVVCRKTQQRARLLNRRLLALPPNPQTLQKPSVVRAILEAKRKDRS